MKKIVIAFLALFLFAFVSSAQNSYSSGSSEENALVNDFSGRDGVLPQNGYQGRRRGRGYHNGQGMGYRNGHGRGYHGSSACPYRHGMRNES